MHLYDSPYFVSNLPKGEFIRPDEVGDEAIAGYLNKGGVPLFVVAYSKGEVFIWLRQEWEMPVVVIINVIFLARLCGVQIERVIAGSILEEYNRPR